MTTVEQRNGVPVERAEYVEHPSLAHALAAFQAELPHVGKTKTAQVKSEKGSYSYTYADLADVAKVAHPVMGRHGLSFSTKPTLNEDGKFVLYYVLRHDSGQEDSGEFPLPSAGNMQAIGASLTYSRRYALCAITGLVADEDTDGRDAGEVKVQASSTRRTAQRRSAQRRDTTLPVYVDPVREPRPVGDDLPGQARTALRSVAERNGWDLGRVAAVFESQHGVGLRECGDAAAITEFTRALVSDPEHVLATDPPAVAPES